MGLVRLKFPSDPRTPVKTLGLWKFGILQGARFDPRSQQNAAASNELEVGAATHQENHFAPIRP